MTAFDGTPGRKASSPVPLAHVLARTRFDTTTSVGFVAFADGLHWVARSFGNVAAPENWSRAIRALADAASVGAIHVRGRRDQGEATTFDQPLKDVAPEVFTGISFETLADDVRDEHAMEGGPKLQVLTCEHPTRGACDAVHDGGVYPARAFFDLHVDIGAVRARWPLERPHPSAPPGFIGLGELWARFIGLRPRAFLSDDFCRPNAPHVMAECYRDPDTFELRPRYPQPKCFEDASAKAHFNAERLAAEFREHFAERENGTHIQGVTADGETPIRVRDWWLRCEPHLWSRRLVVDETRDDGGPLSWNAIAIGRDFPRSVFFKSADVAAILEPPELSAPNVPKKNSAAQRNKARKELDAWLRENPASKRARAEGLRVWKQAGGTENSFNKGEWLAARERCGLPSQASPGRPREPTKLKS